MLWLPLCPLFSLSFLFVSLVKYELPPHTVTSFSLLFPHLYLSFYLMTSPCFIYCPLISWVLVLAGNTLVVLWHFILFRHQSGSKYFSLLWAEGELHFKQMGIIIYKTVGEGNSYVLPAAVHVHSNELVFSATLLHPGEAISYGWQSAPCV